jgi:aspartate-semialdehyde dehydrogenase
MIFSRAVTLLVASTAALAALKQSSAFVPATRAVSRSSPLAFQSSSISPSSPSFLQSRRTALSAATTLKMSSYTVGVVGATGAVGKEIISCLEKSELPTGSLRIFGSERSAGKEIDTKFGKVTVELFDATQARECDVVFLAVSGDFSLEHAEAIAAPGGAVVIDNSSAFRMKEGIPLVVPEINGEKTKGACLIANPNCTTAIGLMALWPLHKLFTLKKVIMSTYQAASGAGQPGMDELWEGTKSVVNGERDVAENSIFAHPLPFNVIPHIDKFQENGYTKEEMKVTWEMRKICDLAEDFPCSCTAVRIPTSRAHSETIVVETELPVDLEAARKALSEAPGVKLVDDTANEKYPMPLTATGQYDVEVGRLRKSLVFGDHGLELFVSGDQLLRGAALNAVLVAEVMAKNGSLGAKVEA